MSDLPPERGEMLPAVPGIGSAFLFPSPKDPAAPISRHLADAWLRKAEQIAEIEPQDGSLWHAYRRKWATERKHLSVTDVARAGGWSSVLTLQRCYQQPDEETLTDVVVNAPKLYGNGVGKERKLPQKLPHLKPRRKSTARRKPYRART